MTTQWLSIDGFQFAYQFLPASTACWWDDASPCGPVEGDPGAPTLILCGAFQDFRSWTNYVKVFHAQGKSVLLLALPGTGESDPLPPEYSIRFLADSILLLLDHLNLDRVSIIAPSYSSPAGYEFGQAYPERVTRLLLCGTMQRIPAPLTPYVEHSIATLDRGDMVQFANEVLGLSGPRIGHGLLCSDPEKMVSRRKLAKRILYRQLVGLDANDRLRYKYNTYRLMQHQFFDLQNPPAMPILIFTGEHDTFTKAHLCRDLAASLPGSQFTTILEGDHMFHLEQFEVTAALFYRFSQGLSVDEIPGISFPETF